MKKKELNDALVLLTKIVWWLNKKKDLKNLFEDILTPKEILEIKERIEIILLLKKWLSQRAIAEKLWVSITTVNRWSRTLKYWRWAINTIIK